MNKKPFVIFGLVLVLLAVIIPFWAFERDGNISKNEGVPPQSTPGKQLFQTNCGNCHRLYAAGTVGDFGPNLDQNQAAQDKNTVLETLANGADSPDVPGRMPPGIVTGTVAEEIADFVSKYAGEG